MQFLKNRGKIINFHFSGGQHLLNWIFYGDVEKSSHLTNLSPLELSMLQSSVAIILFLLVYCM